MEVCFHWAGTAEVAMERLKSRAQKNGVPTRRNQAGSRSSPVVVNRRWSKTLHVDMIRGWRGNVVYLRAGCEYWMSVECGYTSVMIVKLLGCDSIDCPSLLSTSCQLTHRGPQVLGLIDVLELMLTVPRDIFPDPCC